MAKEMRVTRNHIKVCAKFFPSRYELVEYDHGFEVKSHGSDTKCSFFFSNDGKVLRTDMPTSAYHRYGVGEVARILGMRRLGREE